MLFSDSFDDTVSSSIKYDDFYRYSDVVDIKLAQASVITVFTTIHDLISYVFFCSFKTYVDVKTLKGFKAALEQKQSISSIDRSDEMKASIRRNTAMVLTISLVNVIFRLPDLSPSVMLFIALFDSRGPYLVKSLCLSYNLCISAIQSGSVFYMFYLSINLATQLGFNNVFRLTFYQLLKAIFYKKTSKAVIYNK